MFGVLCSAPTALRRAAGCGLVCLFLLTIPAQAWQGPPGNAPEISTRPPNPRGNREKDLLSRPVGEIVQADRNVPGANAPPAPPSDRLTASDVFLLKIVGAILMVSLASLVGLKLLFSHGRKARSPIVGPPPMGSGPPDPDGLRWLSGTVRSVTSRESSRRRRGAEGSDSAESLAKPANDSSPSRSEES